MNDLVAEIKADLADDSKPISGFGVVKRAARRTDLLKRAVTELEQIEPVIRAEVLAPLQELVDKQAEDEGLWFVAETAPEDYLMLNLRELHAAIESLNLLNKP